MNVYQRLNDAREKFHALKLQKTGHNKFAGYYYFELGDFLIPALKVFRECGLCATVSFDTDKACMVIRNAEKPDEYLTIYSPMGSAALKGCHEVQNIGAVETYQRRYLWVAALEIVEHDALDATTGKEKPEPKAEQTERDPFASFTPHAAKTIRAVAASAIEHFSQGDELGAFEEVLGCVDKLGGDDNQRRNDVMSALAVPFKTHSALRAMLKEQFQKLHRAEATA